MKKSEEAPPFHTIENDFRREWMQSVGYPLPRYSATELKPTSSLVRRLTEYSCASDVTPKYLNDWDLSASLIMMLKASEDFSNPLTNPFCGLFLRHTDSKRYQYISSGNYHISALPHRTVLDQYFGVMGIPKDLLLSSWSCTLGIPAGVS
jgi:hypothetical protein